MQNISTATRRRIQRKGYKEEAYPMPHLLVVQVESFRQFLQADVPPERRRDEGLQAVFKEMFPIEDIHGRYSLEFISYEVGSPKYTVEEAKEKNLTYSIPIWANLELVVKDPEEKDPDRAVKHRIRQRVYLCDLVAMTPNGTFIVNGTERVVVNQLHRSPGVYFQKGERGSAAYSALLVPYRGPWIDFSIDSQKVLGVTISKRRKIPITRLLKALVYKDTGDIVEMIFAHYPVDLNTVRPGTRISRPVYSPRAKERAVSQLEPGRFVNVREISDDQTGEVLVPPMTLLTREHLRLLKAHRVQRIKVQEMLYPADTVLSEEDLERLRENDVYEVYISPIQELDPRRMEPGKYVTVNDVIHPKTGEVLIPVLSLLEEDALEYLKGEGVETVKVLPKDFPGLDVLMATTKLDRIKDIEGAIGNLYRTLRYTPPKSLEEAKTYVRDFFMSKARFFLGRVGRFKLNSRLNLDLPGNQDTLDLEDILAIVRRLIKLYVGEEREDDVEDISNRRVRRVGELLAEQFRIAFQRLGRVIKERMLLERDANLTPRKLANPRIVTGSIQAFFVGDRLSQFLDQTNPLAELTHKRRLSALGKGGLTRETAGFEVRDVHPSHYGRLCPIETPEGANIGLITSLTTYARIDELGFITTPLRRVKRGRVTDEVVDMDPLEEAKYRIASADTPYDPKTGKILQKMVWVRHRGGYPMVRPEEVDFMDVSPRQVLSPSAALIPFIEHDDANRALMGSNMQRQAVPLIQPDPPLVGTGLEHKIAVNSGAALVAQRAGVVKEADAFRIVIETTEEVEDALDPLKGRLDIYELRKFERSNQNTSVHQKPLVKPGDRVERGDVIADGPATSQGELALGKNLLVAFMPYFGYNFEDAIVVSERVLKEDLFTSIHILEYKVEVRETKLGPEEVTRDLPNVSEDMVKDLDEYGIVRIGAEVGPDDILVGKISPKGERELLPEEKLIYAIFSEKAKDVKDTSLRVPPGVEGVVVDVVVLSRKRDHDPLFKKVVRERLEKLERETAFAKRNLREGLQQRFVELLKNYKLRGDILDAEGNVLVPAGTRLTARILESLDPLAIQLPEDLISDKKRARTVFALLERAREILKDIEERAQRERNRIRRGDELPPGVIQLIKVYVAQKRKLQVGDKLAGRHGNKGVVARIAPAEDMPFLEDGTPVDIVLNPLGVPSRMNVGQILETILGWAAKEKGIYYATPAFEGFSTEEIRKELEEAGLSPNGKVWVRDGRTGERLAYPVTVGYIYMMKLIHMVEDKVHARAVGPYSLITQQPVGGKSHFGGQRFGEMEVWALEAHGAAYTLQEMLTVKSDDIQGRNRLYKALRNGEEPPEPGLPASFSVLLHTLRGLGLDIEIITDKGEKKAPVSEKTEQTGVTERGH